MVDCVLVSISRVTDSSHRLNLDTLVLTHRPLHPPFVSLSFPRDCPCSMLLVPCLTCSSLVLSPFQAPINAQMLAQRQREILNQHLRQRQIHQQQQVQQRTLMMRGQGLNMTPSMVAPSGIPAAMSNPRIPQANAQQFPFPPNYGTEPRWLPFIRPFSQPAPSQVTALFSAALCMVNQG